MLFFIASSLITIFSSSASFSSVPFSTGLGIGCSTSLPLLRVIIALNSSNLGGGSLEAQFVHSPRIGLCL